MSNRAMIKVNMLNREMLSWLKVDAFKTIFETLRESSKSAKEIETKTGLRPNDIADDLEIMERHGIVEFLDGKWKAATKGMEVYKKYFDWN